MCNMSVVLITIMVLVSLQKTESQITIEGCSRPISGEPCRLKCITTAYPRITTFHKSSKSTDQGHCLSNANCSSDIHGYKVSQLRKGSPFKTYLDIHSLSYERDNDIWTCKYGGNSSSNELTLIVHTIPANVTIALETASASNRMITGQGYCIYPNDVTMQLVFQDQEQGQENILGEFTKTYSNQSVAGCQAHEYQVTGSYQLSDSDISNKLSGKTILFKTRIRVAGLSQYNESAWTEAIKYLASSQEDSSGLSPGCIAGIVVGVLILTALPFGLWLFMRNRQKGKKISEDKSKEIPEEKMMIQVDK